MAQMYTGGALPGGDPQAAPAERRATLWRRIARARLSYLLLAPLFLLLAIFVYYPPISALYHAFYDWNPSGTSTFVGLDNFRAMLADTVLLNSAWNMARLLLFGLAVGITVPLAVAELIYAVRSPAAKYGYRVLFLLPVVAPGIVTILLWKFIYDPTFGLLNGLLGGIGLGGLQRDWLGDPTIALYSFMGIGFPWIAGTSVLIYLAGLMNIPNELMEAAALDGVTGLRRILRIDIPLLLGQVKLFLVLGVIGIVQGFETQLVLTNGGPGFATEVPGLVMYQDAFQEDHLGYAAAIGLALFIIVLAITIASLRFIRSAVEYEGR